MTAGSRVASPPPATRAASGPGPYSSPAGGGPALQPGAAAGLWRRWRVPLSLMALVLIGGIIIAVLEPAAPATTYLDPAGTGANGAHALAAILSSRGQQVSAEGSVQAAQDAARPGTTLVITSPARLSAPQLRGLARARSDIVLVGPDQAALSAVAPGAVQASGAAPVLPRRADCQLRAAQLAGTATTGGLVLNLRAGQAGSQCYPAQSPGGVPGSALVVFGDSGRTITVLGSGSPLTNGMLARQGNAALALNLLSARSRIIWLVPGPAAAAASGSRQPLSLIPLPAYLIVLQLGVAVVLAALWRARRLGPLVPERLPVVVRASETAEGLAGLLRARRARDRAAAALRTAALTRIRPALGLAPGSGQHDVVSVVSARLGGDPASVQAMLFGPAPADDDALVGLAAGLDALERKVRGQ